MATQSVGENLMQGTMQDWDLRVSHLIDYAAREHGTREIVTRWSDGSIERTNWSAVATEARKLSQAFAGLGLQKGDRVATFAMNHHRHLAAWYGAIGFGGVIHTVNVRLFDEDLIYIMNHAEDKVLMYDAMFQPIIDRLKPHLTTVEHYVIFDRDDSYGALIADMPVRGLEIIATNNAFVNPATGEVLDNPTGTVMGQYDFFFMVL